MRMLGAIVLLAGVYLSRRGCETGRGGNHLTLCVIVWRFRPLASRESEFENAYGPSGDWALLFGKGDGYLGTELLRHSDDPREYLTVDRWVSRDAYETFLERFGNEYQQLDDRLEGLTEEETLLGTFETRL